MSIQSEITRLETAKSDIATAITNKGVTVPSGTKLDGMAALIGSIESGGANFQTKSVMYTENGTSTITPDDGYDGLSSVDVTVNVASGGGGGAGFKVTFPATATNWNMVSSGGIVQVDGTVVGIADYSTLAGKTIPNVVEICCIGTGYYFLRMTVQSGKIMMTYNESGGMIVSTAADGETSRTYMTSGSSARWIPLGDTVISKIEMYNTD